MSVQNEVKGERNKVRLALFGGVHWKALVGLSCVIAVFDTPALARLGESSETKRGDKQSPVEHALDELPDSSPYTFVDDPNHVNDLTEEEERAQHGLPDPSPYTFVEDPGHVNDLTEEEERALLGEEWEANPLRLNANEMPGSDTLYAEVEIVLDGQFEIDDILALPQAPGGDFKVLDDETTVVIQIPLETVDRLAKQGADIRVLRSFQLFEGPAYGSVDNGVANASLACSGSFGNGSNGTNVPIPDNAGWVFSPISITGAAPGAIANCIDVHYEITHTWIGDLNVDLNDSNLTHNEDLWGPNQGGSANNLNETVTGITTFNGEAVNQTWKLYVKDIASADTGFIDYWWIKVYFGGPTGSADLIMQSASATPLTGITPGSMVTLADVAKNQGTGSSGSFHVRWYISTNPTMSQSDRQWCTRSAPPLSPGGTSPGGGTCAWPTSGTGSAPGPYWIAPMADYLNEVSESNEGNNWYAPPFQVEVGDGGGDVYEPDNTPTEATSVSCPTTQTHTVHAHGDVDWFAISLQNNASLTIETSNLSGSNPDTFVEIYDDGCGFLAGNDDGGSGLASRLVWSATYTGTHYVKARAFGGSTNHCNSQGGGPADMTYDISFTGCVPPPPIIRVEPLSLTFDCSSGPLSDTAPVTIRLKNAVLTPRPLSEREMAAVASARRSHLILHFADMPDEDGIEALAEQGVEILGYIPDHAVAASVPGGFVPDESSGIDWMGVFEPAFKIATSVSDVAVADDEPVQAVVVEFFADVESAAALAILAGAGAEVIANDFLPAYVMAAWADSEAIQRLASKDAVAWILPASQAIINNQVTYWCPGPLTPWGPMADYVIINDGWDGPGQGSACDLTYHFINGTPDIGGDAEKAAVEAGINAWGQFAAIRWTETGSGGLSRSMDILWASGDHGDSGPFDGPLGVLAHAAVPPPTFSEPFAGDMHFDEDESWSLNSNIHLFTLALHEAGHSLGLGHSADPGAVMYPSYSGPVSGLHQDDINGIRSIYASTSCGTTLPDCFVIHNDGGGVLDVGPVDKPSWVTLSPPPPYNISGGGSQQVCVQVDCGQCVPPASDGVVGLHHNAAGPVVNVSMHMECDSSCNDGTCDPNEDPCTCPQDCSGCCLDGVCGPGENCSNCPDCNCPPGETCTNGVCVPPPPCSQEPYLIGGAVFEDCADPLGSGKQGVQVCVTCDNGFNHCTSTAGPQGLWSIADVPCGTCEVTVPPNTCHVSGVCPPEPCNEIVVIDVKDANTGPNQSLAFWADTCLLHDMNGDGFVSILGDVPCFVGCLFFGDCPPTSFPTGECLGAYPCACDGNHDGFCSILGDVPPFVDCVFFGICENRSTAAQSGGQDGPTETGLTVGGAVYADDTDPLSTGVEGVTVEVRNQAGEVVGVATSGALGIWQVDGLTPGTYTAVFHVEDVGGSAEPVMKTIVVDDGNKREMQSVQLNLTNQAARQLARPRQGRTESRK